VKLTYQTHDAGLLDLTFRPQWDYIEITRLYIEKLLIFSLSCIEHIHRVSIAASELLENAIKYSIDSCVRMILWLSDEGDEVTLSVFNKADRWIASSLIDRIESMNRNDSLEYYVYRMEESVRRKSECSRLGLARVYHECKARISAHFDGKEGIVEVRATIRI
jgi:hypothetical protein